MLTHRQLRAKALENAEVKAEYEKLADEFSLLDEFLKARAAQGLTQAQVTEVIGTAQVRCGLTGPAQVELRKPFTSELSSTKPPALANTA